MKKHILTLAFLLSICLNAFPQAKSLTIDCQTPGWLSSLINYGDQETLESIKVTGYINGTDIKFLRNLNLNRSLKEVIDLENANIVSGGEAYGNFNSRYKESPTTKDNTITRWMFAFLNPIRKIVLPKTITSFEYNVYGYQFLDTYVDTLVINGNIEDLYICDGHDNIFWKTRCIFFPEGMKSVYLGNLFHSYSSLNNIELHLPSTLEKIGAKNCCTKKETIVFCDSNNPETILDTDPTGIYGHYSNVFRTGTIYVPKRTKEKYELSIFRNMDIIEKAQPVTEIKLNITSKPLNVGESFDLVASVLPSDADNKNVVWSSDDDRIATVKNGKVTAVKSGVTRIYATSESDSDISAYCTVTVSQPVTEISLNISSKTLKVGESFNLVATVYPSDADNKKVVWSSENEEIATVNNGKVTAHKPGVTRIYATSEADINVSAYCTVTVTQPVTGISLSQSSYSFTNIGESVQLEAIVTPSDATNKEVKWSSSDEKVCVVSNGKVVATGYGTAVVLATTVDGGYMATCAIIVEKGTIPVTSVTISQTSATLVKGETLQLTATAHPDDATNKELIWKTSDEDVCVVTQKGLIIAMAEGKAVITVVPENGVGQAQCDVEVLSEPDGIYNIVDDSNRNDAIYDTTGCRISNVVKGHLYIRNGKKFIAK